MIRVIDYNGHGEIARYSGQFIDRPQVAHEGDTFFAYDKLAEYIYTGTKWKQIKQIDDNSWTEYFTLLFDVQPEDASVVLEQNDIAVEAESTGKYIVRNLLYTYEITKTGYQTVTGSITPIVDSTIRKTLIEYIEVEFASDPSGAAVVVKDDENNTVSPELGTTYKLLKGKTYEVSFSLAGYKSETIEYTVNNPETLTVDLIETFTVTYAAGDGTGTVIDTDSPYEDGTEVTVLPGTGLTAPAGKVFSKWNDGTADIVPGAKFVIEENTTLTAVYVDAFTVTYDAGDGTGTVVDANSPYIEGAQVTVLPGTGLTPPAGKVFTVWNDGTEDLAPEDVFIMGATAVVLTAVYADA